MKEQEHIEEITMYELKLYIVGRISKSVKVVEEVVELLKDALDGHYDLEVIDIINNPELAEKDGILATPALEKVSPEPVRRIIGNLSDKDKILLALGLTVQQGEVKK